MGIGPGSRTAAIVIIGNEILTGKIVDANTPFLTRELWDLGVTVRRVVVVPDEVAIIAAEVRLAAESCDFVFTSGGVGPTHDDVTMQAVAAAFGRPLERHPHLQLLLEQYYGQRELTEPQWRLAEIPQGSHLIISDGVKYPQVVVENVYIFPGIPHLLRQKFQAIRERFREAPFFIRKLLFSADETVLAPILDVTLDRFPQVAIGSYPRAIPEGWEVLVTLESKDSTTLDDAWQFVASHFTADQVRIPEEESRIQNPESRMFWRA